MDKSLSGEGGLTRTGRLVVFFVILLVVGGGGYLFLWSETGSSLVESAIPSAQKKESVIPTKIDLPAAPVMSRQVATVPFRQLPGFSRSAKVLNKPERRLATICWNGMSGATYAVGGEYTTEGSLAEEFGLNIRYLHEDDPSVLVEQFISFARQYAQGVAEPSSGFHFIGFMGDANAGAFSGPIWNRLKSYGSDYMPETIAIIGRSDGEDRFIGPKAWADNPQSARGGVIFAVLRDGDFNIVVKWANDNAVPINPDPTTYDPNAINFVATKTHIDASQGFINRHYFEESRIHAQTGKEIMITSNPAKSRESGYVLVKVGVTTWTYGDIMVMENLHKGAAADNGTEYVSIASTREYPGQMPSVIVGLRKWCQDHPDEVVDMLDAFYAGCDQIRSHDSALRRATRANADIFGEETADRWYSFYQLGHMPNLQGNMVPVGGSASQNLADAAFWFGLAQGSSSRYAQTYEAFGQFVRKLYPEMIKDYPPASQAINPTYVQMLIDRRGGVDLASAEAAEFSGTGTARVVSTKPWSIEFSVNSAEFTREAYGVLNELHRTLSISHSLAVDIEGHTDSDGSSESNKLLSLRRAEAVKNWLQNKDASLYPNKRFNVIASGEDKPLKDVNGNLLPKHLQRRVEIRQVVRN